MTNQSERGADVNLQDNVKGVIGGSVQHLVKGESSVVHDVVDFTKLAT